MKQELMADHNPMDNLPTMQTMQTQHSKENLHENKFVDPTQESGLRDVDMMDV